MTKRSNNTKQPLAIGGIWEKQIELTNGLTLISDAQNYLEAAKILHKKYSKKLYTPTYFLVLRSIELGFKSILKFKEGISTTKLKENYPHDLTKLMQQCLDCQYISLSNDHIKMIKNISKYYHSKNFEYTRLGDKELYASKYYISISEEIVNRVSEIKKDIETTRYL